MYKPVIIFFLIFALISCRGVSVKDTVDYLELEREIPTTTSVIPTDSEITYDKTAVITKAKTYIASAYNHSTSTHYDTYGLLLPHNGATWLDKGDASGWNAVALSSMCMINKAYTDGKLTDSTFNLQTDINQLWTAYKSKLITSEGTLIRHPDDLEGTSVSKDMIAMFLSMLSIAHYTSCEPIKTDAPAVIRKFIDYGIANDWEYGLTNRTDSSTTLLVGRHSLYDLNNLYGLGYSESQLDLSTSAESTLFNTSVADYINENKYYCRLGYPGSCLRIANAGTFGNHLTFLSSLAFRISALTSSNPVYTLDDTNTFLSNLAKVGENLGQSNWLFVAGYRMLTMDTPTYNDIWEHLDTKWPSTQPTEITGVTDWGCTTYIWQRVGYEVCNGSNTEYVGTDFLFAFSMTFYK